MDSILGSGSAVTALYILGILVLLSMVLMFLAITGYIAYVHWKYSHIPKPKLSRYSCTCMMLKASINQYIYILANHNIIGTTNIVPIIVSYILSVCMWLAQSNYLMFIIICHNCSFYLGHLPDIICYQKECGNEEFSSEVMLKQW